MLKCEPIFFFRFRSSEVPIPSFQDKQSTSINFRTSEVPIPSSPGIKIQIAGRPPSPDDFEVGF